jgi:Flp pilus assembly pilin Flp
MFRQAKKVIRDTAEAFVRDQRGAALWEYALLVVVGLGVAAALMALRGRIVEVFQQATAELSW